VAGDAFETRLDGAGQRGTGGGGVVGVGVSAWRREKEEMGAGMAVGSVGWRRCRMNRGGASAVGDTATQANAADERVWVETGPGGSGQGARETERE
jgi:hypothetical protein